MPDVNVTTVMTALILGLPPAIGVAGVFWTRPAELLKRGVPRAGRIAVIAFCVALVPYTIIVFRHFPWWVTAEQAGGVVIAAACSYRRIKVWYIAAFRGVDKWELTHATTFIREVTRWGYRVEIEAVYDESGSAQWLGSLGFSVAPMMRLAVSRLTPTAERVVLEREFQRGSIKALFESVLSDDEHGEALTTAFNPQPERHTLLVQRNRGALEVDVVFKN